MDMETFREVLEREMHAARTMPASAPATSSPFEAFRAAVDAAWVRAIEPACFAVLGASPRASDEELKRAFRQRALTDHPDAPTGSNEKFIALKRAYDECTSARGRARRAGT